MFFSNIDSQENIVFENSIKLNVYQHLVKNSLLQYKSTIDYRLFNKKDTIGNELGFKNVGNRYSITDFKYCISNSDSYIYDTNL